MSRWATISFGLLAGILMVASVVMDPMGSIQVDALQRLAQAGLAVVALLGASLGGGAALLQGLRRRWSGDVIDDRIGWLEGLLTGWLVWGLLALPVAWLGGWSPITALLPGLLLGAGWIRRPSIRLPSPHPITWSLVGVVALIGVIDASAPPIDTDELYQHLALPGRFLREGQLLGGVLFPDGSRPQLLAILYSPLLAWGTDTAPRLLSTACAVGVLFGMDDLLRRTTAVRTGLAIALSGAIVMGSYSFLHEVGLAANNLPTALAVLATTTAALRSRPIALVVCAGTALSLKYTSAGALVGIWLIAQLPWRTSLATGLLAIACVAPWWIRNVFDGLHPLFPYVGWDALATGAPPGDLTFQYLEKYGAGRSVRDFLLLPFQAVLTAEVGSFRFLGRLTPLVLLLVPPTALVAVRHPAVRRLGVVSIIIGLAWASGPHWLRHLIPGLPLIAVTLGAGTAAATRLPARPVLAASALVWTMGAAANLGPISTHLIDRLPVALGQEPRVDYLHRAVRSARAAQWANTHLPEDAKVAVLFEWPVHLIERTTVLGSVEDHVPVRYWLLVHGDQSLEALREQGVTHLVVGRFKFLRKWYPFLSDAVFESMFQAPVSTLENLLLQEATLVFEASHTRVYRLQSDSP